MCTVQVPDEMARYKQLLFLASKLPNLPAEDHTDDNKVKGCVSQVLTVCGCDCRIMGRCCMGSLGVEMARYQMHMYTGRSGWWASYRMAS